MRVALTGASGYTGGRLLAALLARGDEVSALVRGGPGRGVPPGTGTRIVEGDLADGRSLASLVEGAQAVLHVAAVYRTARHPDSYYRDVNVGGTERLLEAAVRSGVRRFVHTSSVGVHGHVATPPADETAPMAPGDIYQATKAEAERLALRYHGKNGLLVSVVRPGAIYGPGETRLLKLFAFLIAGPRYVSQSELAAIIARHTHGRVLPFRIPAWPVQLAGDLCEALCVPFGIEPPLHRRRVDFWTKSRAFSIEKARRLLGYAPKVDVEEGVARTAAWYSKEGWL